MRKISFIIFTFIGLIFFPSISNAQWYLVETQDPLSCRYYDVTVTDDSIVFISGTRGLQGIILRSLDLGNSFDTTVLAGQYCYDITFPTNLVGYAAVSPSYIYKTIDGGWSWNLVYDSIPFGNAGDIFFLDPDTGFYSYQDNWAGFYRTFNGGVTWTQMIDTSLGPLYELVGGREIVYDNNNLYLVVDEVFLKSSDYGVHWDSYVNNSVPYNDNYTINVIDNEVWMAGMGFTDGAVSKSTDGGVVWNTAFRDGTSSFSDMQMLDPLTGYMISYGSDTLFRFLKTTDGGANWARQDYSGTLMQHNFYMFGIDCLNDSVCFAVGDYGTVYKTYNGGGQLIDVGIPTTKYDPSVRMYPNPIKDLAIVEFDYYANEDYYLTIYNSIGQSVAQITDISSGKVLVDATEYNNGLYFFELRNGSRIMGITKFIKE